jgi:Protein of unknown function (DUF2809)
MRKQKIVVAPTRQILLVCIAIIVPLGLASRMNSLPMPNLFRDYGGDILSATCIYFGVQFLMHRYSVWQAGLVAYILCVLIELQQLITWKPLLRLREETPADILLGHGFLWSDLACYAVGVAIGVLLAVGVSAVTKKPTSE